MARCGPLQALKVLEMAGLAPAPFAGMVLADFGAQVIRIDRPGYGMLDSLSRGKRSIAINLQVPSGLNVVKALCRTNDVIIEPYRPGVMEKLGLGPDVLMNLNKKLIYVRINGFGSKGMLSGWAGHDINFLAISGLLSMFGRKDERPLPPVNLLADFAGGGMMAVAGILMALVERSSSGKGQVVDCSMTEGASYMGTFLHRSRNVPGVWPGERGENLLDSGAPMYEVYETKDGKYMAVGALEPKFYQRFVHGLGMEAELGPCEFDVQRWPDMKRTISDRFKTKTQSEWTEIFTSDSCVTPVLDHIEAPHHPHNLESGSFMKNSLEGTEFYEPLPSPRLSRTPGLSSPVPSPEVGQHTAEVLLEAGYTESELSELLTSQAVATWKKTSSL